MDTPLTVLRHLRLTGKHRVRSISAAVNAGDARIYNVERRAELAYPRLRAGLAAYYGVPEDRLFDPSTGLAKLLEPSEVAS